LGSVDASGIAFGLAAFRAHAPPHHPRDPEADAQPLPLVDDRRVYRILLST
jgi:hypothetical protein